MSGTVARIYLPWSCAASSNLRSEWDSERYTDYRSAREEIAAEAHNATVGMGRYPLGSSVRVRAAVFPPAQDVPPWLPEAEDLDMVNLPKVLCDGLEAGGVYEDDALIRDFRIRERPAEGSGAIVVFVQPMDDPRETDGEEGGG